MAGINKVILVGNLGKDPEMRHLEGGVSRVNFSMATTEVFKDKTGNRVEQTEWHNIVLWRSLADSAEKLLKKGTQIYLEGKLQTRSWQDKEGHKRQTTEIVGESFLILNRRESNTNASGNGSNTSGTGNTGTDSATTDSTLGGDDLPF
ncbi:MAG: single-stranded DNA-binding protein [Bacteroidia bacterium]